MVSSKNGKLQKISAWSYIPYNITVIKLHSPIILLLSHIILAPSL